MNPLKKRIISSLLAAAMILSSLQFSVFDIYAEELTEETSDVVAVETDVEDENGENSDEGNASDVVEDTAEAESDSLEEADLDIITVEEELKGVYQFGDFPSSETLGSAAPSLSIESDNVVNEVNGKTIEEYIYDEMSKRNENINVQAYQINKDDISSIARAVLNEHPELYFVDSMIRWSYSGSTALSVILTYDEEGTYKFDDTAFKRETNKALSLIDDEMSDLQKAIILHDYLAVNCEYDKVRLNDGSIPHASYTAYGPLVNRFAVCQGYALAYKYLLKQVGIESYMVSSKSMNHAWNMIVLNNKYYQVDVTWDDPVFDLIGRARHAYMFCSDDVFKDAKHGHYDWEVTAGSTVVEYEATDTTYDSAFWADVDAPLVFSGDDCYFAYFDTDAITGKINKTKLSDISSIGDKVYDIGKWNVWNKTAFYTSAYTGLFQYNNRLYFNDTASIYSINFDGSDKKTEFTPTNPDGYIYGSTLRNGKVLYSLHQTPSLTEVETVLTAFELFEEPPIEDEPSVIPVESITLSKSALTLKVGDTTELTATVTPSDATDPTVTWQSSDTSIAEVKDGKVTAISAGSCTITASVGTVKADCSVTVEENSEGPIIVPIDSIMLSATELALSEGETSELEVKITPANATYMSITWRSSDDSIAKVENGTVTAIAAGTCDVFCDVKISEENTQTLTCNVVVDKTPVEGEPYITVTKVKTSYVCGDTLNLDDLTVIYHDGLGGATPVTDYTTNEANIDMSTEGTKVLTITYEGLTKSVNIKVVKGTSDGDNKDDEDQDNTDDNPYGNDDNPYYNDNLKDIDESKFTIEKRYDLKNDVSGEIAAIKAKTYDGSRYEPTLKVTAVVDGKKTTLVEGTDYGIYFENNTDVPTGDIKAMVTVYGKGIYKGELYQELVIQPKQIQKAKVVAGSSTVSAETLPIYIYDGTKLLEEGKDYKIKTTGVTTAASEKPVQVDIEGIGNYTGTTKTNISVYAAGTSVINPDDVTLNKTEIAYTGKAITDKNNGVVPTVKAGEKTLTAKTDYKVQYKNNKDVGTAYVIITGRGDYKGTVVKTFEIKTAGKAGKGALEVGAIKAKTYNGKMQKPSVTVKFGDKKLKKNKDYTVYCKNNLHAGTATVVVEGKGNYAGKYGEQTFKIQKQKVKKIAVKTTKYGKLSISYNKRELKWIEEKDKKDDETYDCIVKVSAPDDKNKVEVTITATADSDFETTDKLVKKVKAQ